MGVVMGVLVPGYYVVHHGVYHGGGGSCDTPVPLWRVCSLMVGEWKYHKFADHAVIMRLVVDNCEPCTSGRQVAYKLHG